MRKTLVSFLMGIVVLFMTTTSVFAHAEGGAPATAPQMILQSMSFLEGIHDFDQAQMKAQLAKLAAGNDQLDMAKLDQAIAAMKQQNLEQSEALLAEALKKSPDPKASDVQPLELKYTPSALNTTFTIVAILFILIGIYIIYKVKKLPYKSGSKHQGMQM